MNRKRCIGAEQHYFDGDTYTTCPFCGAAGADSSIESPAFYEVHLTPRENGEDKKPTKGGFLWFGHKTKEPNPIDGDLTRKLQGSPEIVPDRGSESVTHPLPMDDHKSEEKEGFTVPIWQGGHTDTENPQQGPGTAQRQYGSGTNQVILGPKIVEMNKQSVSNNKDLVESAVSAEQHQNDDNNSLMDIVKEVSANEEGKTMGYFGTMKEQTSNAQRAFDPVVGWLVCLEGEYQGDAFKIAAGVNSIGRGSGNKIVFERDMKVSREKHAFITFEPKHREYYLKPGDSLTYLNGEYITDTKKLSKNDKIEIGGGTYLFVSLCDEAFSWDEFIKR